MIPWLLILVVNVVNVKLSRIDCFSLVTPQCEKRRCVPVERRRHGSRSKRRPHRYAIPGRIDGTKIFYCCQHNEMKIVFFRATFVTCRR